MSWISAKVERVLRMYVGVTPSDRFAFTLTALTTLVLTAVILWAFVAMVPALAALTGR